MNHHRISARRERGFTLTEILVAVAIFSIIMTAALLMYDRSNRVFKENVELADLQQNTRVAFDKMVSELRMAGFDYDRDGFPRTANRYQQPDEQLEFVHRRAITFRTNLDYETDAATDNGRDTDYEPGFATTTDPDDDYFPVVTTGNDEIVTYALVSDTPSANDDSITFYADVARPRAAYPESGGANETLVTISGVDLCENGGVNTGCLNPPYTLVRITLDNSGNPGPKVPVATNIRDLDMQFFSDATKTAAVTPNGGVGQYIVVGGTTSNAALLARDQRGTVRAIELTIVGMTEYPDKNWKDPRELALPTAEQVASAVTHRQYRLSSTIIPRNLGKRGLQELDILPPGAPTITSVCWGACGIALVEWDPPSTGQVGSYDVIWDLSPTGSFNSLPTDAGLNNYGFVENLDPNQTYYFKVLAKNDYGSEYSINVGGPLQPRNSTKPEPPSNLIASGNSTATPPAVANQINLTWTMPALNVAFAGGPAYNGGCTTGNPANIPLASEVKGYEIYRSDTSPFTPDTATPSTNRVWKGTSDDPDGPSLGAIPGDVASFEDKTPRVNCTNYYYQIRGYEACAANAALNASNDVSEAQSGFAIAADYGMSNATANPSVPQNVASNPASTCSTDPCSIVLEWDEVTSDVDGNPLWIRDYVVTRTTYISGIADSTSVATFDTVDVTPGDGNRVTFTDNTAPGNPSLGTVYHYTVAAKQCGTFVSAESTPDVQYPCVIVDVLPPSGTIQGSGSEFDPWLIGQNTATFIATSDTDVVSATAIAYDYPARATSVDLGSGTTADPRVMSWGFSMPGSDDVFVVEFLVTDINGCSTTIIKYVQESPTSCCLIPYKDSGGTIFDSSVVTLIPASGGSGPWVDILLKNQCDDDLTINLIRALWTVGSPTNTLVRATYPNGVVRAIGSTTGSVSLTPSVDGGTTTITGGSSTYRLRLEFNRNSTSLTTVTNLCIRYTRDGVTLEDCQVVQTPGAVCP